MNKGWPKPLAISIMVGALVLFAVGVIAVLLNPGAVLSALILLILPPIAFGYGVWSLRVRRP